MGHILSHPVQSKNLQRFGNERYRVGVAEMQGFRTNMEDAHHVSLSLKSHPHIAYIGVFDGHNGAAAAEYMAKHMQTRLDELADPTDHAQLTQAVEKIDADFMSDASVRQHGSTACLVLIATQPNGARKLVCGNVGDSRCLVIGQDGTVKFSTVDHKPDTDEEAQRIRAAGGSVSFGRVDGDLAMSRSIGDHPYKAVPHLGQTEQKVIPTPDCSTVDLAPSDLVLVCCDGLVERLTNQQVASFVAEQLKAQQATQGQAQGPDPAMVMAALLDHSLVKGSKDNMSAALLLQQDGTAYARGDEYRVGPFAEWSSDRTFVDAFFTDARKHGYTQEQAMDMVQTQRENGGGSTSAAAKKDAILLGSD